MTYRLDLDMPVGEALRSAAVSQMTDGASRLRTAAGSRASAATAIHEARKDLKQTRSILRLARSGLPADTYRHENRSLRDIGRSLSDARDRAVLVEAIDGLHERLIGRVPEQAVGELRSRLRNAASATGSSDRALVRDAAAALEQAVERAADWPLENCDEHTLCSGAQRAHERGRRAFDVAACEPTVEHLHALRKRVKDLWYHQRLLAAAWPGVLDAHAEQSHRLSDMLGEDHDLAMLTGALLGEDGPLSSAPADLDPLLELVAERRGELQAHARDLAARVYAERPKAYGRRLSTYVRVTRSGMTSEGQAA
ncbi:MAG: CHAD domain-containing protein [Solirubrobacteraceae bacterium]